MEKIIPELLKKLQDSYKTKDFLSAKECRLLCNSIVDYFESRQINFSLDTMDQLAEQIAEHFPKENKVCAKNKEIFKIHMVLKIYSSTHAEILV